MKNIVISFDKDKCYGHISHNCEKSIGSEPFWTAAGALNIIVVLREGNIITDTEEELAKEEIYSLAGKGLIPIPLVDVMRPLKQMCAA